MKIRWPLVALIAPLLGLIGARQAAAQAPEPMQLGIGYQFLHVSFDGDGESFPAGAYVDVGRALKSDRNKAWGWMGQFEMGFKSGDGFSEQLYTVLGGMRLSTAKPLKWTPSVFGLIGFGSLNASCDQFCAGTESGVAFQGGFAISTRINQKVSANVGFKATKLKVDSGGLFNTAVSAGLRLMISKS